MKTIETPAHFHIGNGPEMVRRAASKALIGWGRAEQVLPDL
jgi:bifunctional non-homologous end joining protein LigD